MFTALHFTHQILEPINRGTTTMASEPHAVNKSLLNGLCVALVLPSQAQPGHGSHHLADGVEPQAYIENIRLNNLFLRILTDRVSPTHSSTQARN